MRLIRWKYVLPRLALVLTVALLFRFGLDPLLKWTIVASGEGAVGAKVELASVETSLRSGEIVFRELAIANPGSPLKNLLQADHARLQIDLNALLHKRVVVRDGIVSGLEFDTDRATSGELPESSEALDGGSSVLDPLLNRTNQLAAQWFDQLTDRLDTDLLDQLETPRVVKELEGRWPEQYAEMRSRVEGLQERIKRFEKNLRDVRKNPLRHLERIGELQQQLVATQQELQTLRRQIQQLPRQADADQRAVLAAREHDQQFLRQKLQFTDLDGEGLSETLLGETVNQRLASALDWISWARRQVPARSVKTQAARGRGTTVLFGKARPRYHIESLQLEGLASLGGQPIQLVGSLTNATSEPHLLNEPTRLTLQGSGTSNLSVEMTLDRRQAVAVDRLHIECPQLALPSRTLGNVDKLAIQVAPGTATVRVDITLVDDQIAGNIFYHQPSVQLTLSTNSTKNRHLAAALGQALAGIGQMEANVILAGTFKKPEVSLRSDLGPQLAAGLNVAVRQLIQQRSQQLLTSTQEKVDQQLQRLVQAREQAQQELLAKLGKHQELLGQLAALTGGDAPGLSVPQLGQSLRLGTQRR